MRHVLIIAALALLAGAARAQEASEEQKKIVTVISRCLIAGLPEDWHQARAIVDLDEPGGKEGSARYLFSRTLSRDQFEPFTPCAGEDAAKALVETRTLQPPERRGWKSARFVLHRDGKFDLTYDYPK